MIHSKKCPQYHLIGYVRLKNSSIGPNGKVIMVNEPGVWTRPGWMMNWCGTDYSRGWLFSAVLLAYLLCAVWVFRKKNPEKFRKISRILLFRKSYNINCRV